MARENPFGIGVDDEDGFFPGVEQDGICRLRADAIDGEKFFTEPEAILLKHLSQAAAITVLEKGEKILEPSGLDIEVACRLDETGELLVR